MERVTRKNKKGESRLPLTISAQYGLVDQETYFNKTVASTNLEGYYLLYKGEFAYNKSYSNGYPYGAIKRLEKHDKGVLSSLYICFRPLNYSVSSDFLTHYFESAVWHKEVSMISVEGARNHGLLNISVSDFFETLHLIPNLVEQTQIGNFLKQLDDMIALHQQELTTLKQTKKGFLQKMFPKEGESVPEVRFPGFTGDWEQRKLESIYEKIRNAFVGTATPYYVEDGHFYLESNNVKDGQINRNTEVFINDEFYEKQKNNWLHTGDLVMVQSGHVGHTAVIPEELDNTAAHALIMFSNYREKADPYFLNYQFQTHKSKKKLNNITTGNTIKHILASEMKKFLVDIPKYEEQKMIGNFFKQLDDAIALHQRELDALKETKKAFLQKMFA
ncbi:Type I restriction-modification system specificity subunit [Bacillus cereus BDRD-Cer4]|nr:Type I restriction-modification system specificity subunit [Bacillus cereus BDRD-Cer4]